MELKNQGFDENHIHIERMLNMRFEGTDTALMVLPHPGDGTGKEDFEAAFKRVYKAEFGFLLETKSIVVDDIKVTSISVISVSWETDMFSRSVALERRLIHWENRCMRRLRS